MFSGCNKKTSKLKWTDEQTRELKDNCKYMSVEDLMSLLTASESRIRTKATLHGFVLVRKGQIPPLRPSTGENP
jgi:hypothetical protein